MVSRGEHLAHARGLEEGCAEREHALENRAPHVGDHALTDPSDQIEAPERRGRQQRDDDEKSRERAIQQRPVAGSETLVDQRPETLPENQDGAGGHDQRQTGAGDPRPVRREPRRERAQAADATAAALVGAAGFTFGQFPSPRLVNPNAFRYIPAAPPETRR